MGSLYELDEATAKDVFAKMRDFLAHNPQGTRLSFSAMGETVPLLVAYPASCHPDEKKRVCDIHLHDTEVGGEVFYHLDENNFEISAPDFRYPAEYLFAQKFVNIKEDNDWCITRIGEFNPTICSKRRW